MKFAVTDEIPHRVGNTGLLGLDGSTQQIQGLGVDAFCRRPRNAGFNEQTRFMDIFQSILRDIAIARSGDRQITDLTGSNRRAGTLDDGDDTAVTQRSETEQRPWLRKK